MAVGEHAASARREQVADALRPGTVQVDRKIGRWRHLRELTETVHGHEPVNCSGQRDQRLQHASVIVASEKARRRPRYAGTAVRKSPSPIALRIKTFKAPEN
jgi:hypothetical protein